MRLLPKWALLETPSVIYDFESVTAIQQTARVYGAMNQMITEYNNFAEAINKEIAEFVGSSETEISNFKESIEKRILCKFKDMDATFAKIKTDIISYTNEYLEKVRGLPVVSESDNNKFAQVVNGMWQAANLIDRTLTRSGMAADAAEVGLLKSRVDNLATLEAGSTTGDAELADLRVDWKGNAHANAGTATRAQASELADAISGIYGSSDATHVKPSFFSGWAAGSIMSDGTFYSAANRITNKKPINLPIGTVVTVDENYQVGLFSFDNGQQVYNSYYGKTHTVARDLPFNIVVYRDDDANVSEDEISGIDNILKISIPKVGQYKLHEYGVTFGCVVNGAVYDYPDTAVKSDYLPVSAGDLVTFYGYPLCCHFYDKEKNYYSRVPENGTYGYPAIHTAPIDGYVIVQATIDVSTSFTEEDLQKLSKSAVTLNSVHGIVSAAWGEAMTNYATLAPSGNNADMAQPIQQALRSNGECRLLPGDYYVSGIEMPENTKLYGAGNKTRVILLDSVTDGAAIKCDGGNAISDMMIVGGMTARPTTGEFNTNRCGISVYEAAAPVKISRVSVEGFSGAGVHVYNTGYYLLNSVILSDSVFRFNRAGVELGRYAEYATITGCSVISNYFGVMNNGGNNKFAACGFDGNVYGFYAENYLVNGEYIHPNNGHGSATGCTFNHNAEEAVHVKGIAYGFSFTGCQFFDGVVYLYESCAIMFYGCQFGAIPFVMKYAGTHHIADCVFSGMPTFEITPYANSTREVVKIRDCYNLFGENVSLL